MSVPEQNRVSEYGNAEYGRPRVTLRYYDQRINAPAVKSFKRRHEAVGVLAKLEREGVADHPTRKPEISVETDY